MITKKTGRYSDVISFAVECSTSGEVWYTLSTTPKVPRRDDKIMAAQKHHIERMMQGWMQVGDFIDYRFRIVER